MFASRLVGGSRVYAVGFYVVVVLAIFAYGALLRRRGLPDVLERPLTTSPSVQNLDGWAATHFFFWLALGVWFPGHYLQALGFSLAWEGFEDFLGRHPIRLGGRRLQLVGDVPAHGGGKSDGGGSDGEQYWYGRYTTDTAYNLMGYIVGTALASRFWPPEDAPPAPSR